MFFISHNSQVIDTLKIITKVVTIITVVLLLMLFMTVIMYKPAYKVTMSDKEVGIIDNKAEFISALNMFLNQESEEIAYIDMEQKPEYSFMLVSRENLIDNERVYNDVIDTARIYYRVYTISADDEEIATLKTKEDADALLEEIGKIKTKAEFKINEAHLEQPIFTENEDVLALVNSKYKIKTVKTASYAVRMASADTIVNINLAIANPARGVITSRYGYRSGGEFHTGIDIANPVGTPIYAAADGTVICSEVRGNYGRLVIIQHADNTVTYYAHCNDLLVSEGDEVSQGDQVATIGLTGRTTGPHVHFEVRVNGETVNPEQYVKNIGQ